MNTEKLSKYLYRFTLIGLYAALLMPFIYVDNLVFPFITGKVFIFQILIEVLLAAYMVLIYIDRRYLPAKSILLLLVTVFSVVEVLSTIFGVDRDRSFWGNYERMSGVFTLLHFFVYFVIACSLLRSRADWRWYLRFALFLSAAEAIIGLIQYFSTNFLLTAGGGRIWGTLGNYIYMATYATVHIFIGLVLWVDARNNNGKNKLWRQYIGIVIALNVISLYLSGTRGGFIGFIAGLGVAFLFLGFSSSHRRMKQIMVLGLCAVVLLGVMGRVYRKNVIVQSLPLVGPLFNLDVSYDTGFTRLIAWEIAIKAWKEKPILGWGQENFYYAFNKYFNPRSLERGSYETWFDRPHNMVLEVLATQGSFGILAYLAIFGSAIWVVIRQYRKSNLSSGESAFALGGLTAYFTQNLFVFDQPSSFLLFYLLLAWFHSYAARGVSMGEQEVQLPQKRGVGPLFIVICLSALWVMYVGTIKPWTAGVKAINGERLIGQNFEAGFEAYKQAVSIKTHYQDDLQISLSRFIHERAGSSGDFTKAHLEKVKFATTLLEDHAKNHPKDVFSFMALGQLYTALAQVDNQYFARAEEALLRASELSPKRQQIYFIWARVKVMQKDFNGAHELLQRTIEFNPRVAESYWYDGLIYNTEGDNKNAMRRIKEAKSFGYGWKAAQELLLYGQLLESSGAYDELPPLLEELVAMDGSAQNYLLLAKSYERAGLKDKSQRALGKAIELDATILNQLQAGS